MTETDEEERISRELASANVNRAAGLIGSSMAIFTFILFFLYPRYANGQIDPVLFQVTLTMIVLTVFAFGFSGLYYYGVVGMKTSLATKQSNKRKGDLFFVLGLIIATAVPAMILYTIGLTIVAVIATVLWLIYTFSVLQQGRRFGYC